MGLWQQYRGGDWTKLPTSAHVQPLKATFEAWAKRVPGIRHRADVQYAGKILIAAAPMGATLADLPGTVEKLRRAYVSSGRMFNKLRDAASAFLRATVTRNHPLYRDVRAIEALPVTKKYPRNPQGPAEARVIHAALSPEAGRIWWMLCCTGMGPKELWSDGWTVQDGHLHIHGKKRKGRERVVPLITDLAPPKLTRWGFTTALRRSGLGVSPYDGRRSFAFWMELARIFESHQRAYMGHGKTLLDLYRGHDVTPFLDEDAGKLTALVVGKVAGLAPSDDVQVVVRERGYTFETFGLKVRCSTPELPAPRTTKPDHEGR